MAGLGLGLLGKIKWFTAAVKATKVFKALKFIGTIAFWTAGVKGFMQMRDMMSEHQSIMANKTAAGGKIPVIYGTRRVGSQIVFMDTVGRKNRDLYVVYALAVGECEEILGKTIEIGGNSILDEKIFKKGGYVGSDKITSGAGSLCTADQNGDTNAGVGGGLGTDPTKRYQFVFNLHHGADSQTADPMLRASIPTQWSTNHKLNGICYIAAHFHYSKTGVFQGVPQITVQVKGKKVYDPRESGHTFGDPSTYEWSSNPALCYLDYITNDSYGKGLAESDINMSTFESAADVCDVEVDQPYYNGAYQSVTWSGTSGDDFIIISDNDDWYQNKTDEIFDLRDNGGTNVFTGAGITGVQRHQFYDDDQVNKIFINETLTSTYTNEAGSARAKVKRFHCNGYINTNKTVMENAKELLTNMRGIFTYINGKYELQIEDTGTSTFSITDDHIISDTGISIDYGDKDKKANKVIIEFFNSQTGYELDTATVLHDATPEYYSDDGEILEVKAQFPLITDAYIAYNMGKAILTRSRNQMTMQFLGTPEMYKLNVGDIVDLTYAGLGLSGKVCRVESLELQSDGLVNVSLIEYFDVYTWEVPAQEEVKKLQKLPSKGAVHPPEATSIVFTDTDASAINRPTLTWTEPDDFDVKEFRVDVVDSLDNNVFSKIVDTPSVDLSFLPKASNYEASITAFNTLDVESEPVTKTFTIADDPVKTTEVEIGSETLSNIIDYGTVTGQSGNWFQINGRLDLEDRFIWNSNGDNYWALGTAGDDDVNLKIEGGANTLIQFKDQDNALGTVKLAFGDDVGGDYSHDFIHLVADYTQGNHATDAKSIFYIKGRANDGSSASGDIAKFTFGAADGVGFPSSVLYGTTTTPILITEDYIEIEQATAPSTTTDKLYNVSGVLHWNGSQVGVGAVNSVTNMVDNRVLTASGSNSINGEANLTFDGSTLTVTGDQVITGNLTVQGTTTTIDTTNLDVKDKNITLNYGTGDTSANADGAGITIQDAVNSTTNATILWATVNDTFNFSHPVSVTGNISTSNSLIGQTITVNSSGYGTIEVGGVSGAYIDLKRPNTDDFDLRLITTGTGGQIVAPSGATIDMQIVSGTNILSVSNTGINVTGNIVVSGTVDGRDVATDGSKLDGIEAGATTDQTQSEINALGITAIGLSGSPNITVGTISSGAITSTGAIISTNSGNRLDALSIGDDSDIYLYEGSTNVLNIRTGASGSYKYFTFQDDGYFNTNSGGISTGGTARITSGGNLTNIGTISSGAIGVNGDITLTEGDKIKTSESSGGSHLLLRSDNLGVTGNSLSLIGLNDILIGSKSNQTGTGNIYFGYNAENKASGSGWVDTLTITDSGNFEFNNGNFTEVGTISSGAITTSGTLDLNSNNLDHTAATPQYTMIESDVTGNNTQFLQTAGDLRIRTVDDSKANAVERLRIDHATGDISFYEDTGTTAKLFWDASAERLGIGTTSPDRALHVSTSDNLPVFVESTDGLSLLGIGDSSGSVAVAANGSSFSVYTGGSVGGDTSFGTEAMRIDSSGNVGIGTSNPLSFSKLHLEDSANLYFTMKKTGGTNAYLMTDGNTLRVASSAGTTGNKVSFSLTAPDDSVTLDSSGNVGIGTTSPACHLNISGNGNGSVGEHVRITSTDTNAKLAFVNTLGNSAIVQDGYNLIFNNNTANVERARIDAAGNVGIGTTDPNAGLQIAKGGTSVPSAGADTGSAVFGNTTSNNAYGLVVGANNAGLGYISAQRTDGTATTYNLSIQPNGGNVGIGTENPNVYSNITGLTIDGTSGSLVDFEVNGTLKGEIFASTAAMNISAYGTHHIAFTTSDSGTERMRIDSSGNVGIGTSSPSVAAHVSGKVRVQKSGSTSAYVQLSADELTSNYAADIFLNDTGLTFKHNSGSRGFVFDQNGTERMRIDSSGRLLVGKTSSSIAVAGHIIESIGRTWSSVDGAYVAGFNRLTSDGEILQFRKDGSTVGSIGVISGDVAIYSTTASHNGLRMALGAILPTNNAGSVTDNVADLGSSLYRFKDLHLSGDIIAAGDISTNELVVDTIATIDGRVSCGGITIVENNDAVMKSADNITQVGSGNFVLQVSNAGQTALKPLGLRAEDIRFATQSSERARIDSSGNLLVGKTSVANLSSDTNAGHTLYEVGAARHIRSNGESLQLTRTSSDGVIAVFTRDGTTKGQIGILDSAASSSIYFASGSSSTTGTGLKFVSAVGTANIIPCRGDGTAYDNAVDLGSSNTRFDDIYATNGTIQTSDRNEKQDIQELSEAEQKVAVACKGLIRRYKFNSAVAEKGDDARYHFGIIAQDLQDAFTAEGLDASDYGMFISETWTDEEGNEQTKLGVRYNELLAFIIATL